MKKGKKIGSAVLVALLSLNCTTKIESYRVSRYILASGSWRTIKMWDVADPKNPKHLKTLEGGGDLAFSSDSKLIASARPFRLWDVTNPKGPKMLSDSTSSVEAVAFGPYSQLFVLGIRSYVELSDVSNPKNPKLLKTLKGPFNLEAVAFSPDGKLVAAGFFRGIIKIWDVRDRKNIKELVTPGPYEYHVKTVAFSPDSKRLALGSDNNIELLDVSNPKNVKKLKTLTGHKDLVNSVAFSHDGNRLASGSRDKTIKLWDVSDPENAGELKTLSGSFKVTSVAFSPNSKLIVSGHDRSHAFLERKGPHGVIGIWDVSDLKNVKLLKAFSGHAGPVVSVAFRPVPGFRR